MSNKIFTKDMKKIVEDKRGKELSPRHEEFLDAVLKNDFDVAKAGQLMGYESSYVPRLVRSLKDELLELMRMRLVMDAGVAMKTIVQLMTADKVQIQGDIKLRAAQQILDRIGLTKPEKIEIDHNVKGGLFIIPAKDDIRLRDIEGEVVND